METFFSLNNPLLFSIVLLFALGAVVYIYYRYVILPLNLRHTREKENLELQNAKLMALFAELDPEPVFRFNLNGEIISANQSGAKLFPRQITENIPIETIFPSLQGLNFSKCIKDGTTYHFTSRIQKDFYDITVKGVTEFDFGQIYCNDITVRKNVEEELLSSRRKLQELSKHIQIAQELEKQNLSRELHDNFGQILTAIKLNLELIKVKDPEIQNKVGDTFVLLEKAMNEVRDLSYRLKPRILDDLGLVPSLKLLCNDVTNNTGIKNIFQVHDFMGRLKPELETCLYRIAQEALNNISKHSHASEFSIQLFQQENQIRMMIEDDGTGFETDKNKKNGSARKKMGLLNIQERTLSYGGRCNIDSQIGSGTSILVELPLEESYG